MNAPATVAPVAEGDVLAGKYRVERVIGVGGMGVVVAARHVQLGQLVALKFLLKQACASPEAVERFLREARAAVRIESEHVARVIDVGTLADGAPYMVMEFLVGADLSQVLRLRGPLPIEEAVGFVLQACEAVAEAHALGIVHRDLKPANLFLSQRKDGSPLVKVLDFGISKQQPGADSPASMTATAAVMGSPMYMSPEQMRSSKNVDCRTDIWALGQILYELIAARPVYDAEALTELCAMIATDPPKPLRACRPEVPQELDRVVLKCLEKDVNARYQNVGELATALLAFGPKNARLSVERAVLILQMGGTQVAMPPSAPEPVQHTRSDTAAAWGATRPPQAAGRMRLIAGMTVAVAAIGVVGLLLGIRRPGASTLTTPETQGPSTPAGEDTAQPSELSPPLTSAPVSAGAVLSAPTASASAEKTPPSGQVGGRTSPTQKAPATAGPGTGTASTTEKKAPTYNPFDHL